MTKRILRAWFLIAIGLVSVGTVVKKKDAIELTQTNPASYQEKAKEQAENDNPKLLAVDRKQIHQGNKEVQDIDAELEQLLARQRATIKIFNKQAINRCIKQRSLFKT